MNDQINQLKLYQLGGYNDVLNVNQKALVFPNTSVQYLVPVECLSGLKCMSGKENRRLELVFMAELDLQITSFMKILSRKSIEKMIVMKVAAL